MYEYCIPLFLHVLLAKLMQDNLESQTELEILVSRCLKTDEVPHFVEWTIAVSLTNNNRKDVEETQVHETLVHDGI